MRPGERMRRLAANVMYSVSDLFVRGLRRTRSAVEGGGRRALGAEKGQNRYDCAGVEGSVWDGAGRCSAPKAVKRRSKIWRQRYRLIKHMECKCAANAAWTCSRRAGRTTCRQRSLAIALGRVTPGLEAVKYSATLSLVQLSGPFKVPLKLSACDCCLFPNIPQSVVSMAKSKDKQTKQAKAAKPSTTVTQTAFDPALSSLFASSVRAELFRKHETQGIWLTAYTVGSSTSASQAAI